MVSFRRNKAPRFLGIFATAIYLIAPLSTLNARSQSSPRLKVGCFARSVLQSIVFSSSDQKRFESGIPVPGKIGIKDQIYSYEEDGDKPLPVRTSITVDYDGKSYGRYAYIIESPANDSKPVCVTEVIDYQKLSGKSFFKPLQQEEDWEVLVEGKLNEDNIITIIIDKSKGLGGTYYTNLKTSKMTSGKVHTVNSSNFDKLKKYINTGVLDK